MRPREKFSKFNSSFILEKKLLPTPQGQYKDVLIKNHFGCRVNKEKTFVELTWKVEGNFVNYVAVSRAFSGKRWLESVTQLINFPGSELFCSRVSNIWRQKAFRKKLSNVQLGIGKETFLSY